MTSFNRPQRGFTLIELMIVLLIMAMIVLVAAPFTRAWSSSARLTEGKGIMMQAVGRAIALSQRNPMGVDNNFTAAALCVANNVVTVYQPINSVTSARCNPVIGNLVWSRALPVDLEVKRVDDSPFVSGFCFSNRGILETWNCNNSSTLNLTAGSEDENAIQFL